MKIGMTFTMIMLVAGLAKAQSEHRPDMEIKAVECSSQSDHLAPRFELISYADVHGDLPPFVIRAIDAKGHAYAETDVRSDEISYRHTGGRPSHMIEYIVDLRPQTDPYVYLRMYASATPTRRPNLEISLYPFRELDTGRVSPISLPRNAHGGNDYHCKILD